MADDDSNAELELEPTSEPETESEPEPKTAIEDADPKPVSAPVDWPEDWRDKIADGDEKLRARMNRFPSPKAVWDSFASMEDAFKKGQPQVPFPEEGTDEDKTAWRKDQGIPETPEDYKINFDESLNQELIEEGELKTFLLEMHDKNVNPKDASAAVNAYLRITEQEVLDRHTQDAADKASSTEALQAEYGEDMKGMLTGAYCLLDSAPGDLKAQILGARLANGTALGNDTDAVRWMASMALQLNPGQTVVPGGGDSEATIEAEINDMQALMADRNSDYYKGPNSDKMQARYRQLLEAHESYKVRDRNRAA
jgi:hypothetical protein